MTAKIRARILVVFALMGIAVVPITYAQAPSDKDKAEVTALNQRLIAAFNIRKM